MGIEERHASTGDVTLQRTFPLRALRQARLNKAQKLAKVCKSVAAAWARIAGVPAGEISECWAGHMHMGILLQPMGHVDRLLASIQPWL